MSELKYKVGDKVLIKSLDWYNENKNETGRIGIFIPAMSRYCGKIVTIKRVEEEFERYLMSECPFYWTDEMIECIMCWWAKDE